jgi:hypothetical protein
MTLYIVTRPEINAFDAKPPLVVNGIEIEYELDTPCHLDDLAVEAINNTFGLNVAECVADHDISSPASGDGDGAASPDGGAADGSADSDTTNPLDHDGDGLPGKESTSTKGTRRKAAAKTATTKE